MPRPAQFNIRSDFVRERAISIARSTGMTATQVVEAAMRSYTPPSDIPPSGTPGPHGLVWEGRLLVVPSKGRIITHEEAEAALEAARNREDED